MKYLLAICLLLPVLAPAQHNKYEHLAARWFKDSSGGLIVLPPVLSIQLYRRPHLFSDTEKAWVICSDTVYKALFRATLPDSLPVINFTTHYLVGRRSCIYCGPHCTHKACHRNACRYIYYWGLTPKEKPLPVTAAAGRQ